MRISTRQRHHASGIAKAISARPWPLVFLFIGVLLPLYLFSALADEVWEKEGFSWDGPIQDAIHKRATPARDRLMIAISRVGGPIPMLIVVAGVATKLYRSKRSADGLLLLLTAGGAIVLNVLAKLIFRRVRPALWQSPAPETDYSFPSGHSMGSLAAVLSLIILSWSTAWRGLVVMVGGAFAFAVGLSRVYLGVHFPSDVLAAWAASIAWVVGLQIAWSRWLADYREDHPLTHF